MRVVLDFQACQSASRFRGIGRGSRGLMLAMARRLLARDHEVVCMLSEAFADGLEALRADIASQVPEVGIRTFRIPTPCAAALPANAWRQMAARMLREHAIAAQMPDFVHVPALLADGWGDDAVGSIGVLGLHVPTSLTQHDLIPLVMADEYMPPGSFRDYYMDKLAGVKQADLLLAISEYSRREAIELLAMPAQRVVHISSAAECEYWSSPVSASDIDQTLARLGVRRSFMLYAPGGFDYRKNITRLLEAYALLPAESRAAHQLVIASGLDEGRRAAVEGMAAGFGISPADLVLTDYVPDEDLRCLYHGCFVYLLPSLHEGFGLPVLEAMACGAPVIASDRTSIPEVIGLEEALFDPFSVPSMAAKMLQLVRDEGFRQRLVTHAAVQPGLFSWDRSAQIAVDALELRHAELRKEGWQPVPAAQLPGRDAMLARLASLLPGIPPDAEAIAAFDRCVDFNLRQA